MDELNSPGADNGVTLSQDGLVAYFSSDRSGGLGASDLYEASRASTRDPFSAPVNLAAVNSTALDVDPALSPDGQELFFISLRNGSNTQLFRATRTCP